MTIQFYGWLRGEKSSYLVIRKWNDHMTNILGVEIEREFGIKYSKSRMEDAITFFAHKRTINLPAMYMKSMTYDGKEHISSLLSKYLGGRRKRAEFLDNETYLGRYGKTGISFGL